MMSTAGTWVFAPKCIIGGVRVSAAWLRCLLGLAGGHLGALLPSSWVLGKAICGPNQALCLKMALPTRAMVVELPGNPGSQEAHTASCWHRGYLMWDGGGLGMRDCRAHVVPSCWSVTSCSLRDDGVGSTCQGERACLGTKPACVGWPQRTWDALGFLSGDGGGLCGARIVKHAKALAVVDERRLLVARRWPRF